MKGGNRFYFKACPRCKGDIYLDEDAYGRYGKCLQCGRIYEVRARQRGLSKLGSGELAA